MTTIDVFYTLKTIPGSLKAVLEVESLDNDVIQCAIQTHVNQILTTTTTHLIGSVPTIICVIDHNLPTYPTNPITC